jgi:hypothetical protein
MKQPWKVEIDGQERTIYLVPKFGYLSLPVGTVMYSILGERVVVGEDYIDMDTRNGYLAYGILEEEV